MDYQTATMADVILRSLQTHPSCLADAMEHAARTHAEAARVMVADKMASNAALGMACDAQSVVNMIQQGDLCDATVARIRRLSFGRQIMLFGAAAKLLCLPHHLVRAIADRG